MNKLIDYDEFTDLLIKTVYKDAKSDLLNKVASNPDRYIGIFRPTSSRVKLIQNITQSHEISFGDFIEDIITAYLGNYYDNLPKKAIYHDEEILFDQLFKYNGKIFMIEQKMRDDHDSTKKRGQYENFIKKVNYLLENYPNTKIEAGMWFVDNSLTKNKKYYKNKMDEFINNKVKLHLFYGNEFTNYLGQQAIWDEITTYLVRWKMQDDESIELNFENNWKETKFELEKKVSVKNWKKIVYNKVVVKEILPILFPTGKYKEILKDLNINMEEGLII